MEPAFSSELSAIGKCKVQKFYSSTVALCQLKPYYPELADGDPKYSPWGHNPRQRVWACLRAPGLTLPCSRGFQLLFAQTAFLSVWGVLTAPLSENVWLPGSLSAEAIHQVELCKSVVSCWLNNFHVAFKRVC